MRWCQWYFSICVLLVSSSCCHALPAVTSNDVSQSQSNSTHPTATTTPRSLSATAHTTGFTVIHAPSALSQFSHHISPTRLRTTDSISASQITHHFPTRTLPPEPTDQPVLNQHSSNHQPVVAIVFEAIAGVVALLVLAGIARCVYSWKKTPNRDRIATVLNRHQLQREMEEVERDDIRRRLQQRSSLTRPPPPPYQPAPVYDSVVAAEVP